MEAIEFYCTLEKHVVLNQVLQKLSNVPVERLPVTFASTPAVFGSPLQPNCSTACTKQPFHTNPYGSTNPPKAALYLSEFVLTQDALK